MEKEGLQNIITDLEQDILKEKATFGIYQYGGGSDASYIKANDGGLILFAITLLKAVLELKDKGKSTIPFSEEDRWVDPLSDTGIHYIESVAEREPASVVSEYNENIIQKYIPIVGCYATMLVLILSIFVGLWTMLKWIF
jgi:hypothetical protein